MKLLVDANLSPKVARALVVAGHEAVHVADVNLLTASDVDITSFAADHNQTIVTCDTDFGTLLAASGASQPSVILLRHHLDVAPERLAELVIAVLDAASAELNAGAFATLSRGRLRVRRLPVR